MRSLSERIPECRPSLLKTGIIKLVTSAAVLYLAATSQTIKKTETFRLCMGMMVGYMELDVVS